MEQTHLLLVENLERVVAVNPVHGLCGLFQRLRVLRWGFCLRVLLII